MDERLIEMVRDALVLAGELAYVEGAYGASAVIEQFDSLFRYMTRGEGTVAMADEIRALRNYAFVQHTRHHIAIETYNELNDIFINRKEVIRFVDECCTQEWEKGNANAMFRVRFVFSGKDLFAQVEIQNGTKSKTQLKQKSISTN